MDFNRRSRHPSLPFTPAVIRQGEMQYIDGPVAKWASGHFVLTRAGFLHWFRAMDQVEPIGTLGLARLVGPEHMGKLRI